MTHTPGPWLRESEINSEGSDWILVTKDYAEIVDLRLDDGLVVSEQEQEANARLIAAAPELLAALRFVLPTLENAARHGTIDADGVNLELEAAREVAEAIAKAEGRE
jgi:hypothetical protein